MPSERWLTDRDYCFAKYFEKNQPMGSRTQTWVKDDRPFEVAHDVSLPDSIELASLPTTNADSMKIRAQIGRGILIARKNSRVLLYNRSPLDIFFDSTTLTLPSGSGSGLTTHKLQPGFVVEVFNFDVAERQPQVRPNSHPDSCRISFKKGFGSSHEKSYKHQGTLQCECWTQLTFRVRRPNDEPPVVT